MVRLVLHFGRSSSEGKQGFKERPDLASVWGPRQSGEKLFLQHFPRNTAAAVGMRRTTIGVVPRTRATVTQRGFLQIPAAQLHQRVHPLVQVPTTNVRPHVANLLLPRTPHFLHIVKMFLDRPAGGNRFQNVAHFRQRVRAEVWCPTAVLEAQNHHTDLAADQLRRCQKRLVLTSHLDAAALIGDRQPTRLMPGPLGQTDFVLAVDAVAVRTRGGQVKQTSVLAQAADDHDLQSEYGEEKRPHGVGAIDRQPHLCFHAQRGSTA